MTTRLLITGAGRGIGAAAARLAGARGWRVGVNYAQRREAAEATVAAVVAAGGQAVALPGDMAEDGAIDAVGRAMTARFGGVDAVVVNAGVIGPRAPLADMPTERIRRIVDVNVTGALLTCRWAAQTLGPGGAIVIVSSTAARLGAPDEFIDYAASKGAMDALTLGLSKELGPRGVRVNAVRPGLIETEIHADAGWTERAEVLGAQTPLRRAGAADEVAESILWLASDAASYVSGAILDVAGGR